MNADLPSPRPATPAALAAGLPLGFLELLALLMRQPSVVGSEHSFFRVLQRELEERGAQVTWYEGLLVAHGNKPTSLMLSAHVDRHGLICTGPNEFQYAAFVAGARSDLLGNSVGEQLMKKIVDRFGAESVYAYEPWSGAYCGRGVITRAYICEYRNNLIFEVQGLEHLVAGTPVAFADALKVTDRALVGQLDNVLTTAALVYLFDLGFQGTTARDAEGKRRPAYDVFVRGSLGPVPQIGRPLFRRVLTEDLNRAVEGLVGGWIERRADGEDFTDFTRRLDDGELGVLAGLEPARGRAARDEEG